MAMNGVCLPFKRLWHCLSLVADCRPLLKTFLFYKHPTPPHASIPQHHSASLSLPKLKLLQTLFSSYSIHKFKTMQQPGEVAGIQYLAPINPSPYLSHFGAMQNNIPDLHLSRFLRPYPTPTFQIPPSIHELTPQLSSISNNSTSDEAEEHQLSVIDERKQRRMISNRESARRSRMRKQKHLDELWSQVVRLRTENRELIDKLNHVLECHDRVLQENNQLREEASNLHQTLRDLQLNNPYANLQDMEDVPCNTAHLRAESTNQSIATSMDLLH